MTFIEAVDPVRRVVRFGRGKGDGNGGPSDIRDIVRRLHELGVTEESDADPILADSTAALVDHRAFPDQQGVRYEASFVHTRSSQTAIGTYLDIILSTYPAEFQAPLRKLRLGVYELAQNSLEHGIPTGADPVLGLALDLQPGAVKITIQDQCREFNPLVHGGKNLRERLLQGAPRGYGITITRILFEDLKHEFNETGNRLTFSWRFDP